MPGGGALSRSRLSRSYAQPRPANTIRIAARTNVASVGMGHRQTTQIGRLGLRDSQFAAKAAALGGHAQQSESGRQDAEKPPDREGHGEGDRCRHAFEQDETEIDVDTAGVVVREERRSEE